MQYGDIMFFVGFHWMEFLPCVKLKSGYVDLKILDKSLDVEVRNIWVKFQIWMNYPFKSQALHCSLPAERM